VESTLQKARMIHRIKHPPLTHEAHFSFKFITILTSPLH
jgi:hypothetical protein